MADTYAANVDEVFIDLCRQIIRRDNTTATSVDDDYGHGGYEEHAPVPAEKKRRRNATRRRTKGRCTIL